MVFSPTTQNEMRSAPPSTRFEAGNSLDGASSRKLSGPQRGGDPLFACLVEQFYRYVFAMFRHKGLDAEDMGDLTQETFLRTIEHLTKGRNRPASDQAAKSLLARVARSVLIDFWRKREGRSKASPRPRLLVFTTLAANCSYSGDAGPASDFPCQVDQQVGYIECLDHLRVKGEPVVAKTVELVAVGGYPIEEAASILGVEVWVIQWRLRRAEQLLRNALA